MSRTALVIVVVILVVVGLGGGMYFRRMQVSQITQENVEQQDVASGTIASEVPKKQDIPRKQINCGSNLKCLADAAKACSETSANVTLTLPVLYMNQTRNMTYKIYEASSGLCSFYQKFNSIRVTFPPEVRANYLAEGFTEQEIVAKEKEETEHESVSFFVGKEATCLFSNRNALVNTIKDLIDRKPVTSVSLSVDLSKGAEGVSQQQARAYAQSIGADSCSGSQFEVSNFKLKYP